MNCVDTLIHSIIIWKLCTLRRREINSMVLFYNMMSTFFPGNFNMHCSIYNYRVSVFRELWRPFTKRCELRITVVSDACIFFRLVEKATHYTALFHIACFENASAHALTWRSSAGLLHLFYPFKMHFLANVLWKWNYTNDLCDDIIQKTRKNLGKTSKKSCEILLEDNYRFTRIIEMLI